MFKKISRILRSEARGLKPRSQDNLSGWGLAGTIAGVSAGGLGLGTLLGRYAIPKQGQVMVQVDAPKA